MILLLMSLSACCTKSQTKIKHISIPIKYLQCDELPTPEISLEAQIEARDGDYKLFTIELVQDRKLLVEPWHNECVENMKAAREYQERIDAL